MSPGVHVVTLGDQPVEQVAARKSGRARNERLASHGKSGSVAVLTLVVLAEFRVFVLDRPPPALVLPVPRDRLGEPLVEGRARPPPDGLELRRVERVAPIVARSIGHGPDQARGLAHELQDPAGQVGVLHLVAAADVIDLAGDAALDEQVHRAAVIVHVQPVALVLPVAVERDRDVVDEVRDEERNDLLGELVRAVVVRRA